MMMYDDFDFGGYDERGTGPVVEEGRARLAVLDALAGELSLDAMLGVKPDDDAVKRFAEAHLGFGDWIEQAVTEGLVGFAATLDAIQADAACNAYNRGEQDLAHTATIVSECAERILQEAERAAERA